MRMESLLRRQKREKKGMMPSFRDLVSENENEEIEKWITERHVS